MKNNLKIKAIFAAFIVVSISLFETVGFAAGNIKTYITNLSIVNYSISEDYSVLSTGLNLFEDLLSTESEDKIYLAYNTGKEKNAITDIRVLTYYNEKGVKINGIEYSPVSSVNLNQGTDGTKIYMYYTKDTDAGEPIIAFDISAYRTDKETESYDGDSLLGNGFEPVKNENGEPANLDLGRNGLYLYLHELHKTIYKPYITNIHIASADDRKKAIFKLASLGCQYFIDEDITNGGKYVMVGYSRTEDKSRAVSSLRGIYSNEVNGNKAKEGAVDYTLTEKISIDSEKEIYLAYVTGGNSPIYILDVAAIFADQELTVADCAEINFCDSSIKRYVKFEEKYQSALNDTEALKSVNVPIANDNEKTVNLSIVYKGTESFVNEQISQNMKKDLENDDNERETQEGYTGELLTEEGDPIYFSDDEKTTESNNTDITASAFGNGGTVSIIVLFILVCVSTSMIILKKKKILFTKKEVEEENKK